MGFPGASDTVSSAEANLEKAEDIWFPLPAFAFCFLVLVSFLFLLALAISALPGSGLSSFTKRPAPSLQFQHRIISGSKNQIILYQQVIDDLADTGGGRSFQFSVMGGLLPGQTAALSPSWLRERRHRQPTIP